MPSNLLSVVLTDSQLSSQQQDEQWPTFDELLQSLHYEGIYIHAEQLAEYLLAQGLPVQLRYVPQHLRTKAIQVNQSYRGDMVRLIEEEEQDWDYSWMNKVQMPEIHKDYQVHLIEEGEQPEWDGSWLS
ncbi:MAG: hypothetical protein F6J86_16385 [Symploca sp. SIO1B1]|nr:hypothetical protein [Symploca sp. SIO2D2]NER23085.1 hypothetical protein [Symploca sp. SIO1C2]NER46013.1 hypothetical protein [Symploca sp. SIO1A3]NER95390.1 hypothetical protein [Symploca sp. SIO1B1]